MTKHTNTTSGRVAREERKDGAKLRAEERAAHTPALQLKALDARLGKGVGAARERARLAAKLKAE